MENGNDFEIIEDCLKLCFKIEASNQFMKQKNAVKILMNIENRFQTMKDNEKIVFKELECNLKAVYKIESFETIDAQKGFKKVCEHLEEIKKNLYCLLNKYKNSK
ncbi:hypothetical protein MmarC5_1847 (plasmid) [Methanococcus maripaludis C5]|uniref:Uncharacterized protein n=1 Tax=Methanococcus maripaludis (strain C5 / ATCC BAA-1333) TaxID=402880 RepID=O06107_METM5|nr:hypothetical protein [Methanococcus maripaludis]AAC45251.1 unknown [Methanococcus maripaludis C5]ABO36138.1 hypothetical protein MmarC5_1847 [Methanococcus maripaludis C5]